MSGTTKKAPTMGPNSDPTPPMIGAISTSIDIRSPMIESGNRLPCKKPNRPPPTPAKPALIATTKILLRKAGTPSARAASSSSLMPRQR